MEKSFAYVTFLICCSIALSTTEENPTPQNKAAQNQKTLDDADQYILTCVPFEKDYACETMCSIVSIIYGYPKATGTCGWMNYCDCIESQNSTFDDYWKAKFNSDKILQKVKKNQDLSEKVFDVLQTPKRSFHQTIQDLKPLLPESELKMLRPKNRLSQTLIAQDGTFDKTTVEKYVAKKLNSFDQLTPPQNYRRNLLTMLNDENLKQNVRDEIVREIRHSQNNPLNRVLDQYFDTDSKKEPNLPTNREQSFVHTVGASVVNQIISWYSFDYHVTFTKTATKSTLLWVNLKSRSQVQMKISEDGNVEQEWTHNGNQAVLTMTPSEGEGVRVEEIWEFTNSNSQLELTKLPNGTFYKSWYTNKDEDAWKQFQGFIDSWCQNNEFYVRKEYCSIYTNPQNRMLRS